jgi:predicted TIM-barrel fold metal-dependent hydrolase
MRPLRFCNARRLTYSAVSLIRGLRRGGRRRDRQPPDIAMRIVALEEHFSLPALGAPATPPADMPATIERVGARMVEVGAARIADMDRSGITMQVLSKAGNHMGPSADMFEGDEAIAFARRFNDEGARRIAAFLDRLAGFAHLPNNIPEAAADELERAVRDLGFKGALISGTVRGDFLDNARFAPLLARAEMLDVPLYIHPGLPPAAVRKAYYEGFAPQISFGLATFAWGWHYETALHVMRLAVSGTFDRYPRLKWIIGHMGEGLPAMLARCEHQFASDLSYLARPLAQTITDQVYVTTSGLFTNPPFMAALATFGIDRLMFAIDYPYAANALGRNFLDNLPLPPADIAKLAHGNADRLLKLNGAAARAGASH